MQTTMSQVHVAALTLSALTAAAAGGFVTSPSNPTRPDPTLGTGPQTWEFVDVLNPLKSLEAPLRVMADFTYNLKFGV